MTKQEAEKRAREARKKNGSGWPVASLICTEKAVYCLDFSPSDVVISKMMASQKCYKSCCYPSP